MWVTKYISAHIFQYLVENHGLFIQVSEHKIGLIFINMQNMKKNKKKTLKHEVWVDNDWKFTMNNINCYVNQNVVKKGLKIFFYTQLSSESCYVRVYFVPWGSNFFLFNAVTRIVPNKSDWRTKLTYRQWIYPRISRSVCGVYVALNYIPVRHCHKDNKRK